MKEKAGLKEGIRELRNILELTQAEFALMIGVSKDAVASWEIGRNEPSTRMIRRIALTTGVEGKDLTEGRRPLTTVVPLEGRKRFSKETLEQHRKDYWGQRDESAAEKHLANCEDALRLIFLAAARANTGKNPHRLPAVVDSFVEWCERTYEDFQLERQIEEQLKERKSKLVLNLSYGEWRRKQKEEPRMCRIMGFRDDPTKRDKEYLRLETETIPIWRPGYPMRAPRKGGKL